MSGGTVLVSGATGFIGGRAVQALVARGLPVRAMVRRPTALAVPAVVADLDDEAALARACAGIDVVLHCAGYAHAFGGDPGESARRHREVNLEGTLRLARRAVAAGVRRLVFVSSVKARGEAGAVCADEDWPGEPESAYGRAKWQAERGLAALAAESGLEVVVLRPAMVYGRGGHGNLERMAAALARGRFPALPETGNRRSLIHVADVVDALLLCAEAPAAAGQTFNLSHPEAVSGAGLERALRHALGLPPAGFAVPATVWSLAGRCGDLLQSLGWRGCPLHSGIVDRLLGSACYDASRIRRQLGWQARVGLTEGLREMLAGEPG